MPALLPIEQAYPFLAFHRRAPGFELLDEDGNMRSRKGSVVRAHPVLTPLQAFGGEHLNDLHFTCYNVRNRDGGIENPAPRMTKGVLALLERQASGDLANLQVVGSALAVDYDLPNHAKWTPEAIAEVSERLTSVAAKAPLVTQPSVFYTTAKGLRLVWFLSELVPVDGERGLEDLLGGLIATCVNAGLTVDPSCRDWTRIFRLPRVRREDEKAPGVVTYSRTVEQPYLHQSWGRIDFHANEEAPPNGIVLVYPPSSFRALSHWSPNEFVTEAMEALARAWKGAIGKAPQTTRQRMLAVQLPAQPTDGDVATLLGGDQVGSGSLVLTHSIKSWITGWAKIKGRNQTPPPSAVFAFEVLYGGRSLVADPSASGQLHAGILKLANAMCFTLREQLGNPVTPDMIYALVLQRAREANAKRVENRRDDATLSSEVWSAVGWAYQQFRSQTLIEQEQEQEAVLAEEAHQRTMLVLDETKIARIKSTLLSSIQREHDGSPALPSHYAWVDEHWRKLLIVNVQKAGNAVLRFTPSGEVAYSLLAPTHGALLSMIRDSGHSFIDADKPPSRGEVPARLQPESENMLLREYSTSTEDMRASRLIPANAIELQWRDSEMLVRFIKRLPGMRQDIAPRFDPRVHEWLCALGGSSVERFLDWLAAFPRIDQQCCGLYIQGPPGIGKGMLAKALANMTEARQFAPFHNILEQFQDMMVKTPFVWMDESPSTSQRTQKSMMHTYKMLITGEYNSLNGKGDKAFAVEGHWRVMITANRDDALKPDKDMSEVDLEAITVRTLHIKPDDAACARVLEQIGGRQGTERWPEAIIPAHIAWLVAERAITPGRRLLVEGEATAYHAALATRTEGTDTLLRTLASLLRIPNPRHAAAIEIVDDFVRINSKALRSAISDLYEGDRTAVIPHENAIERSLKHLSGQNISRVRARKQPVAGSMGQRRVWDVKIDRIIRACHAAGEDVNFQAVIGEQAWKAHAPPEIQAEYVQEPPPPPPPAPPRPAYTNGHNGHAGTNGHHASPNAPVGAGMPVGALFTSPSAHPHPN